MEFLGVGLPELVVILVITLIVVGPQRLPEMAAQIARAMREFRRYTSSLSREVTDALGDLEKEYTAAKDEWKEVGEAVQKDVKAIEAEVSGAADDVRKAVDLKGPPASSEEGRSKVVSMGDAASRRAQTGASGRGPVGARPGTGQQAEGPPDPPAAGAGADDQRPAEQGRP